MKSGNNSTTEIQAEQKALVRLKVCLVLLVAVPLLLGGLFFGIAYFCDVTFLYLLASAMGMAAIALGGRVNDLRFRIKEKEQKIQELS